MGLTVMFRFPVSGNRELTVPGTLVITFPSVPDTGEMQIVCVPDTGEMQIIHVPDTNKM